MVKGLFRALLGRQVPTVLAAAGMLLSAAPACGQGGPWLKHRVFLYWGYNRAQFTNSNIRFSGEGYNFMLKNVVAVDKPEAFTLGNYFDPKYIWIPQYNYRAGWFLNEKWSFSIGLDHMKYVMVQDQRVAASGTISPGRWAGGLSGEAGEGLQLTPAFLRFEHTDGLNLLSLDADHYSRLWHSANGKHGLWLTQGLLAGPVIPRTDVHLFGEGLNNPFHLAGYGAGAQAGLFALLQDRIFVRANVRAGYIDLPDILTTGRTGERAAQHFWFIQENVVVGVLIGSTRPRTAPRT